MDIRFFMDKRYFIYILYIVYYFYVDNFDEIFFFKLIWQDKLKVSQSAKKIKF